MTTASDETRLTAAEKKYYQVFGEPGEYRARCPGCNKKSPPQRTQTRAVVVVENHMIARDCGVPMLPPPVPRKG